MGGVIVRCIEASFRSKETDIYLQIMAQLMNNVKDETDLLVTSVYTLHEQKGNVLFVGPTAAEEI